MTAANGGETGGVLTAQTLARLPMIVGWIVEGRGRREVIDSARDEWGISERQAHRLIALARAELVAEWSVQRQELTAVLLARLDREYRAASGQNNPGAAIAAVMATAKLAQL
jgi:hypothetical protein